MDRSPGGPGGSLGGSSGVTHSITSKKIHFYIIHIVLDKINVNLTELSLDLVNFVGSTDVLKGGTTPTPYWRSLLKCHIGLTGNFHYRKIQQY